MSLTAAAIRTLADKGLSASDIADVAEANAPSQSSAAVRQKRYRDKKRNDGDVTRDVTPPPNEYISNPPTSSEAKASPEVSARKRAPKPEFEIPEWVPAEPWSAFVAMRKAKRKPLSDYAAKQLVGKLRTIHEAGWSLTDVINKAVVNQNDGFWMPDGRDPNIRRAAAPANDSGPKTAEWHDAQVIFWERISRTDKADEHRAAATRIRSTDPPAPIASLIKQATGNLRVNH